MTGSSPPTQNYGNDMLKYVLRVLELAEYSPLAQTLQLEGREDITSLLEIEPQDLEDLQ